MSVMTVGAEVEEVSLRPAFDSYVATHGAGLLRHATVVTADPHAAADVVQAVLERAYRRWARISTLEYPDAYVRRMIVNESISAWRRVAHLVALDRTPEPPPAEDETGQVDERDALIRQIRKLPPRQRAAIALRYYADLSDAQIAEQLGCAESTVRGYLFRALRALRQELESDEH
jgi:RNA polymerase sigma-70 factor (sigma-E family)